VNAPTTQHYVIVCDRVFDPDRKCLTAKVIEVKDGRFVSVEPMAAFVHREPDVEVFDLLGFTLCAPLVDPHVHYYMNPWPLDPGGRLPPGGAALEEEVRNGVQRLAEARLAGVGLVRDLGDPHGINIAVARQAAEDVALPRALVAGAGIYREGRYGRFIGEPVQSSEELNRMVLRRAINPQIDVIKLIPTGIINFRKGAVTSAPQFTREELQTAVGIAHDHGKMVAAHCSGEAGIRIAVEAGIDFIEHGYFISRETMDLLGEKSLVWTPTFAPVQAQWNHAACCGWDDETKAHLRRILDDHAEMLRYASAQGVCIMAGSDAGSPGVPHGGGLLRELEIMQEAGIPCLDLLAMATTLAASWVAPDKGLGRIAPGNPADFIAIRGAVGRDIANLRAVEWVARDGRVSRGHSPRMETDPDAESYGLQDSLPGSPLEAVPS
jgi:imidazolonepropionase-like amidohydrolase